MSIFERDAMSPRRFKTTRTIMALVLREMSTSYGRSPGGYLWAILEPAGAILMLSLGFSLFLRDPPLGSSFLLFFATGFLPFGMYNSLNTKVSRALNFSRPLLSYPGVTYTDAILARFLLDVLTQVMVFYAVITGVLIFQDTGAILDFPPILIGLLMAALLGLGIGVMNCFLIGVFPVWAQIWSIATRPLFFVSGVFFTLEDMPSQLQDILWFNPLMHVTGLVRRGFYSTYGADYVSLVFGFGVGAVLLALGLVFLGRYHRDILTNN